MPKVRTRSASPECAMLGHSPETPFPDPQACSRQHNQQFLEQIVSAAPASGRAPRTNVEDIHPTRHASHAPKNPDVHTDAERLRHLPSTGENRLACRVGSCLFLPLRANPQPTLDPPTPPTPSSRRATDYEDARAASRARAPSSRQNQQRGASNQCTSRGTQGDE